MSQLDMIDGDFASRKERLPRRADEAAKVRLIFHLTGIYPRLHREIFALAKADEPHGY